MEFIPRKFVESSESKEFRITGLDARILLFDDGYVDPLFFGKRFISLDNHTNPCNHASRIASICAFGENKDGNQFMGIAPRANIICIDYGNAFPNQYKSIVKHVFEKHGRVDISGHAYSGVKTSYLERLGKDQFHNFTIDDHPHGHLVIASAGHDGSAGIRFPGCIDGVLTVGVCDSDFKPTQYCSIDAIAKKPEILVPDYNYLANVPGDKLAHINGTSAAVGIVCGISALLCEYLRDNDQSPFPSLLKALLLVLSVPSPVKPHRVILPLGLRDDNAKPFKNIGLKHLLDKKIAFIEASCSLQQDFKVDLISHNDVVTISFVESRRQSLIGSPRPLIMMEVSTGNDLIRVEGKDWLIADISSYKGQEVSIKLRTKSDSQVGYLAVSGVSNQYTTPKKVVKNHSQDNSIALGKVRMSNKIKKPLTIVGISASHDASACVIRDGKLEVAIQLERISRIKRDGLGFLHSEEAIRYCLEALKISDSDVDYFAFNSQPLLPDYYGLSQPTHSASFNVFNPFSERSIYVSHHLAHAFSAYFSSPYTNCAVFVYDGSGGSTVSSDDLIIFGDELNGYLHQQLTERPLLHVQSSYNFCDNQYTLIDREYAPSFNVRCGSSSLGETYAAVSQYIFGDWQEGGKLMGLAPYGSPESYGPSLLKMDDGGLYQFRSDWKNDFRDALSKQNPMIYKHLAARVQADLETALLQRFKRLNDKTTMTQIAYAGGLALNCVANERIRKESGFEEMYVFPASNDAGISVGAAAAAHFKLTKSLQRKSVEHVFLGYSYTKDMYEEAVSHFSDFVTISKATPSEIAKTLSEGKVYGLFEGASEFGPRALGHRSIIADPRQKETWIFINRWVKYREDFRPFAPAVPWECAGKYFEIDTPSPYMLRTVMVKPEHAENLGAITHVNGTARIQTVDKQTHPRFHELLLSFGELSQYPILVNTSLNVRGQPLAETPIQAIEILLSTHLDGILFGDYLVKLKYDDELTILDKDVLMLAPDTKLVREGTALQRESKLLFRARKKSHISLKDWQYDLLFSINGTHSVNEVMKEGMKHFDNLTIEECNAWLESLVLMRALFKIDKK